MNQANQAKALEHHGRHARLRSHRRQVRLRHRPAPGRVPGPRPTSRRWRPTRSTTTPGAARRVENTDGDDYFCEATKGDLQTVFRRIAIDHDPALAPDRHLTRTARFAPSIHSRAMKILVVGSGGVGAAFAPIAARRDFYERIVFADIDERVRGGSWIATGRTGGSAPRRSMRPTPRRWRLLLRACAADVDPQRRRPAVRDAGVRGRAGGGRRLPGHGDVAVGARTPSARTKRWARSWATTSSRSPGDWEERGRLALVGIGIEPGAADVFAKYAAEHLFSQIDEVGVRDGSNIEIAGHSFAPDVLDLDDDRGVPEPARDLGEGPGVVHHRAVLRARGLPLPRGDRRRRVRQRGARGGAARARAGSTAGASPSSTAWATSSSRSWTPCTSWGSTVWIRCASAART